mmetsp:Transcript_18947/g.47247  ORF Transcript_18947/g.47247 Transcript_18947/m.47247 type:complete len:214 (-) Transcript_18947:414-1055(-)
MATDTGCMVTAFSRLFSSDAGTSLKPSMVTGRLRLCSSPHLPAAAVYAQSASVSMPLFFTIHLNALSIRPPLQPMLPLCEHDTSSSSDTASSLPVLMAWMPSTDPVVEKAQQDPHWPWFFTAVTAPALTQSTLGFGATSANSQVAGSTGGLASISVCLYPSMVLNSSVVRSAKWFSPTQCECLPSACSALCRSTNTSLAAKMPMRRSSSSTVS